MTLSGGEPSVRFLTSFAAAVAGVLLFAWASQSRQDERISASQTAIAVINSRLDGIGAKLDEIRAMLAREAAR